MTLSSSPIDTIFADYRDRVNQSLDAYLSPENITNERLSAAMRYSVLQGGKRFRPVLVYATGETLGVPLHACDPFAMAVELIHAYSLVHDDLPAMDNDDLRRGQPTCHKAFDPATAILAGDALQTLAFHCISYAKTLDLTQKNKGIQLLSQASGPAGMVAGQMLDMQSEQQTLSLDKLEGLHQCKTGALIRASVLLGGLAAQASPKTLNALDTYASAIGLAFQIQDDILDVVSDTSTLGKRVGADAAHQKATYPQLLGLQGARQRAQHLINEALQALELLPNEAPYLRALARYIVERLH
ncbi:farnesyl diphosphate synthase [Allopseudospirillum japonicum]|uniref:Farnesyl diphosphate synthase n=1 Tax=Allopseudospirillum japonicum TaxID=64971 RepID=A0A1H6UH73_9GAMM|nr:farnesyl diphosphate synthase [Allopseudospirillum japonicum]SEI90054.1 farnesyl diphosphate synthase [Allopseudospirillum japonicum]